MFACVCAGMVCVCMLQLDMPVCMHVCMNAGMHACSCSCVCMNAYACMCTCILRACVHMDECVKGREPERNQDNVQRDHEMQRERVCVCEETGGPHEHNGMIKRLLKLNASDYGVVQNSCANKSTTEESAKPVGT